MRSTPTHQIVRFEALQDGRASHLRGVAIVVCRCRLAVHMNIKRGEARVQVLANVNFVLQAQFRMPGNQAAEYVASWGLKTDGKTADAVEGS